MTYQLLIIVFALIIFGIFHSHTARDRLQLSETYHNWPLEIVSQGLLILSGVEDTQINSSANDAVVEVRNRTEFNRDNQADDALRSSSIEEIRGIRFREPENATNIAIVSSVDPDDEDNIDKNRVKTPPSPIENQPQNGENIGQMLAAISASLQKLSTGKTDAQLYDILLQESSLQKTRDEQSSSKPIDVSLESDPQTKEVTERAGENSAAPEVADLKEKLNEEAKKLYFGEKPLEYVANQSK